MHISPHLLLTAYILLMHTLTTAMWLIGGTWMGLSRRAASEWMRASLANGVALLLMVNEGSATNGWLMLVACTLAVLGIASLRRGLLSFLRQSHTTASFLRLIAVVAAFNLLVCAPLGWASLGMFVSSVIMVALLLNAAWKSHASIAREFRRATAITSSAVLCSAALVFALTSALVMMGPATAGALLPQEVRQVVLVFVTSVLSIVVAFVQGYIVVMRLVNRLQHLSHHDSLTGLLNRRAIEQSLAREAHRLQRFSEPFSVLLVDIDHFKRINDQLGHAAGDEVLRQVAHTLMDQAREVDRVARYGGEEFCVLLPHTDHEGAVQAAERLRAAVLERTIAWQDGTLNVTVSTGVACATLPTEAVDALLRRADDALYRAKAQGRNRVEVATQKAA